MARDIVGSPKIHQIMDPMNRRLTYAFVVAALCALFYALGAWQNSSPASSLNPTSNLGTTAGGCDCSSSSLPTLDFEAHHQMTARDAPGSAVDKFPACPLNFSEYTPCQDRTRGRRFERTMLVYRERHCPGKDEAIRCLVPAPPNYKTPFGWPKSRDYAWYDNIPHKELSIEKAVQNWIQVEGDRFRFPGGGTMFPRGADAYIDDINALIPLTDGSIRTAIDTGCGVSDPFHPTTNIQIHLILYQSQ